MSDATPPPLPGLTATDDVSPASQPSPAVAPELVTPAVPTEPPVLPGIFYRLDTVRFTVREYFWGIESWRHVLALVFGVLLKLLRIRLPGSTDDPCVESLERFETSDAQLPLGVHEEFAPLREQLEAMGFSSPLFHAIDDPVHATTTHLATFLHPDGRSLARIHRRLWTYPHPPRRYLFVEYLTPLDPRRFLWSISARPDMLAPPCCRLVRRIDASPADLWAAHLGALSTERLDPALQLIHTVEGLRRVESAHHAAVRDFHVERGVFCPLKPDQILQILARRQARQSAAPPDTEHAEVMHELDALQRQQTSWLKALLILLISLGLFIALGVIFFDWGFILLIVPVLFFHELGHYVAMRWLKYRNIRMFFIPLLGAAVSGSNHTVAGWKKVLVFLAGPVPGIVLGAAFIGLGAGFYQPAFFALALPALVLNGLNLLPVLPLDGGWVAHTLVFTRHPLLDVLFRSLAAFALLAVGFHLDDKFLLLLGGFMLLGIPAAYRMSRISHELRRAQFEPIPAGEQAIPPSIARTIIPRIKAAFSGSTNAHTIAQHTLKVFESINARPPRWPAALGLGALYLGSAAVAVFGTLFCLRAMSYGSGWHLRPAPHRIQTSQIIRRDNPSVPHAGPRHVVVATCRSTSQARDQFDQLASQVPPDASIKLFGQSVLISIPGPRFKAQAWSEQWAGRPEPTLVTPASFHLTCKAPGDDIADDIETQLNDYLRVRSAQILIPPWVQPDTRSFREQAAHQLARRTWRRIAQTAIPRDATTEQLEHQQRQASEKLRPGDWETSAADPYRRIAQRLHRYNAQQWRVAVGQLSLLPENEIDRMLVKHYLDLPEDPERKLPDPLAPRLGTLPATCSGATVKPDSYITGWAERAGHRLRIRIHWLPCFEDDTEALIRWLERRGCRDFRYDFEPSRLGPNEVPETDE